MARVKPLPLAVFGAAVIFAAARATSLLELTPKYLEDGYAGLGASLLYGLPDVWVTYCMPSATLALAALQRLSDPALRACLLVLELLVPLSAFVLGLALEGAACGWLALAAALVLTPVAPAAAENSLEGLMFTATFLLAAAAAVWRARERSTLSTYALASVVLASVLIRSPLFLFPFAVLAADLYRERSWSAVRKAAPLFWVPLLGLLPWVFLNWSMYGRLVLLENGRSAMNVVTAALGMVHTYPAGHPHALWLAHLEPGESVTAWAVREVLHHPLRYVSAIPWRFVLLITLHPLWLAAAALCLWLRRSRPEYRAVALSAGYFVGIHCLLSVEARYFLPLWPLCGALAAALLLRAAAPVRRVPEAAKTLGALAFVPFAALGLWALALAATYPSRAAEASSGLAPVLAKHADEPFLWQLAGKRAWDGGDVCGASEAYARALKLRPTDDNRTAYAKALMARVGPRQFVLWPESPVPASARVSGRLAGGRFVLAESDFYQALDFTAMGQTSQADRHFAAFQKSWKLDSCRNRQLKAMEAVPTAAFRAQCRQARSGLLQRAAAWPPADRALFKRRLDLFGCGN